MFPRNGQDVDRPPSRTRTFNDSSLNASFRNNWSNLLDIALFGPNARRKGRHVVGDSNARIIKDGQLKRESLDGLWESYCTATGEIIVMDDMQLPGLDEHEAQEALDLWRLGRKSRINRSVRLALPVPEPFPRDVHHVSASICQYNAVSLQIGSRLNIGRHDLEIGSA